MPFKIIRNDLTKMHVDAIVNTANTMPTFADGTDTAVYQAAGAEQLLEARKQIGYLREGEVAITPGFRLPAKYIIHAVSPLYLSGWNLEAEKLRSCYEKSLMLALEYGCKSVAFPLIATGSYGYPKAEALEIALSEIHKFLLKEEMMVYLVVFDDESVRLSGQIFHDIESYIDTHYVEEKSRTEYQVPPVQTPMVCESVARYKAATPSAQVKETSKRPLDIPESLKERRMSKTAKMPSSKHLQRSLEDIMANVGETFQQQLFRLIDEKGRDEVDVYKGAYKDKKFFSKIRSNVNYKPSKHTVFAFALSLQLSLDETKDLLASAGFAFSPSSKFDLIMQYVIEQGIYDIYRIDCILYDFGEEHYFACE